MSKPILTLGGVVFRDMEIPESISFGGRQRVAVQNLIGGGRSVDVLGPEDGQIKFSGIFQGVDASDRAQLLDALRAQGQVLTLAWGEFGYDIVIEEFSAEYRKSTLIPFSISCTVVASQLSVISEVGATVSMLVNADVSQVGTYAAQAALVLPSMLSPTAGGLGQAQIVVAGAMVAGAGVLSTALSSLNAATSAQGAAVALGDTAGVSQQLAAQAAASGYLNRATTNLMNEIS